MFVWFGFIFAYWLFSVDRKWRPPQSAALWVPALWMAMLCSRSPSFWIGGDSGTDMEGSPINSLCLGGLIVASIFIVSRRKVDWGDLCRRNKWLVLIYLYFAISVLWSEFPLACFKRWFTDLGQVLVALVILTDVNPGQALRATFVRVGYLLLPMSIILIRFVSSIGRVYTKTGGFMVTGVAEHKNSLGAGVMVLGVIILWDLLESRQAGGPKTSLQKACQIGIFLNVLYLLVIAHSATAQFCFIIGAVLLLSYKRLTAFKNAKSALITGVAALTIFMAVDSVFDLRGSVFQALGRDESLTGRTEIWAAIGSRSVNPLIGSGYRGFWETPAAGESIWQEMGMYRLLSAHNGYLETYLNGGTIGVVLLGIWLLESRQHRARQAVKW